MVLSSIDPLFHCSFLFNKSVQNNRQVGASSAPSGTSRPAGAVQAGAAPGCLGTSLGGEAEAGYEGPGG